MDNRTSVYLYYDEYNFLIYVGVTSRGMARNQEHDKSKSWWKYVVRQDVEHYRTRGEALDRERHLIVTRKPPFNTQLNKNHKQAKEEYFRTRSITSVTNGASLELPKNWYELVVVGATANIVTFASVQDLSGFEFDDSDCRFDGAKKGKVLNSGIVDGRLVVQISASNHRFATTAKMKLGHVPGHGRTRTIKVIAA